MSSYNYEQKLTCQPSSLSVNNVTKIYNQQEQQVKLFKSFQEDHLNMNVIDSQKELVEAKKNGITWAYMGMTLSDYLSNNTEDKKVAKALEEAKKYEKKYQLPKTTITIYHIGSRNFAREIANIKEEIINLYNQLHGFVFTKQGKNTIQRDLSYAKQNLANVQKEYKESIAQR